MSRGQLQVVMLLVGCGLGLGCSGDDSVVEDDQPDPTHTGNTGSGGQATTMNGTGGQTASAMSSGGNGAAGHAGAMASGSGGMTIAGSGGAQTDADGGMRSGCVVGEKVIAEGATLPAGDDCNTCMCTGGMLQCTLIECGPKCVVAKHLDDCCGEFEAMLFSDLVKDQCLAEYPASGLDPARLQSCRAKNAVDCATVSCPEASAPASRIAAEDGHGGCRFADECNNNSDCALATDLSQCCACPESVPVFLFERSACLSRQNPAALRAQPVTCSPPACQPVLCGTCPDSPTSATCLIRDSFSICQ